MICRYETEHYIFNFVKGSMAEKDIREIAAIQEECYERICRFLSVKYPHKISYFFYDSPYTIGKYHYGDESFFCCGTAETSEFKDGEVRKAALDFDGKNIFTVPPYSVHAVYEERIKSIGAHEDTHIIAAMINDDATSFLCEGLAQYMEGSWQGHTNLYWTNNYYGGGDHIKPSEAIALSEDDFYAIDCNIIYPLAGAWVEFFLKTYGSDAFKRIYACKKGLIQIIELISGMPICELDNAFLDWVKKAANQPGSE